MNYGIRIETRAYSDAHDALLRRPGLVERVRAVAENTASSWWRELKQDYVFQWATMGKSESTCNSPSCLEQATRCALFIHVQSERDNPLSFVHVIRRWIRSNLVSGQPGRFVCRNYQSSRRKNECVVEKTGSVTDLRSFPASSLRFKPITVPAGLRRYACQ